MKNFILFLLILLSINSIYSQISFEKGYYIDNYNNKVDCLIKNIDWKNNPTEFEFKLSDNTEIEKTSIKLVKEFGIYNESKYIRKTVNIDRSSESISKMSYDKNPVFNEEELFLKVLVEGNATLYIYEGSNIKKFFYNKKNSRIEQLIFKSYKTSTNNYYGENNKFRQQLWINLKCSKFNMNTFKNISYKKNELVQIFITYNECNNQKAINFTEKEKKDLFNLNIRPRINSSTLNATPSSSFYSSIDSESKIGFGLGLETEFILPFNKNKWAIILEPTYQSYKFEKTTESINYEGGVIITNVDYTSIEIPIGLRHNFFINQSSKLFINASYVIDLTSKSNITLKRADGQIIQNFEIATGNNLGFGIGYKFIDKYILEMRYQTDRQILNNYPAWETNYNTLSVIFGYTLF